MAGGVEGVAGGVEGVGGVEMCGGRGGGVWWEGWRSVVGGIEECGGRGKVYEGRGGGEFGRGSVWVRQVSSAGQSR